MALVAQAEAQRTIACCRSQAPGAGDGQGDTGRGLRRPACDVKEMILARLEERRWSEEGQWPERFCTGE